MKTIYLDSDYKCHVTDTGGLTPVETDFFDGKCTTFIEGYRYIPEGEVWHMEDGTAFFGRMIAPWRDYALLLEFQAQYDAILTELSALQGKS